MKTSYNSKSLRLSNQLLEDIRKDHFPAGSVLPMERELAARYRVSRTTVRRAVDILKEGQQVVRLSQRAVQVVGAKKLSSLSQIAFLTHSLGGEANRYAAGISCGVDKDKYTVAIYCAHSNLDEFRDLIGKVGQLNPQGMIVASIPKEECDIRWEVLAETGIPCVVIGDALPGLNCDRVSSYSYDNGRTVAEYIVDHGWRDAAVITTSTPEANRAMLDGIRNIFEPAGIPLGEDRIHYIDSPRGYAQPPNPYIDIEEGTKKLLAKGFRAQVIICGHDYPALGVLRALLAAGIKVPQEMRVISCMQAAVEGLTPMRITTIDTQRQSQGRTAAALLMRRLSGYDGPPEVHYASRTLVEGETT